MLYIKISEGAQGLQNSLNRFHNPGSTLFCVTWLPERTVKSPSNYRSSMLLLLTIQSCLVPWNENSHECALDPNKRKLNDPPKLKTVLNRHASLSEPCHSPKALPMHWAWCKIISKSLFSMFRIWEKQLASWIYWSSEKQSSGQETCQICLSGLQSALLQRTCLDCSASLSYRTTPYRCTLLPHLKIWNAAGTIGENSSGHRRSWSCCSCWGSFQLALMDWTSVMQGSWVAAIIQSLSMTTR